MIIDESLLKADGISGETPVAYSPDPVKTVSILSTDNAKQKVASDLTKINGLSPTTAPNYIPPPDVNPDGTSKVVPNDKTNTATGITPTTTKVTLLNPDTGQQQIFENAEINKENIQALINAGYSPTEISSSGTAPSWLTAKTTGTAETTDPGVNKLKTDLDTRDKKIEDLSNEWLSYNVDTDPAFQARSRSITAQYDQLRSAMAKQNEARMRGYETLGLRSGTSRYAGEIQMGITGEELTQANQRIADLNRQEADAITSARTAYQSGKWSEFSNKVSALDKIRDNKAEELKNYNDNLAKILKEVNDSTKAQNDATAKVEAERVKNVSEVLTSARKNNAPMDVIKAIQGVVDNGGDVGDAVIAAGKYGTEASGPLGEYYQYKREGGTMDWKGYKNWDDNNKARVQEIIDQSGLNKEQRNRVAALQDDYDKQLKDIKTVLIQSKNIDALAEKASSKNTDTGTRAASQIGLIFSYMKILDPTSTVREGEYATAQNTAGVADKIRNSYNKALDGSFLTDNQVNGYKETAKALAEVRRRNKEEIDTEFDRRGSLFGIPKGTITTPTNLETPKISIGDKVKTALNTVNPKTNKNYSSAEVLNHLLSDPTYGEKIKAARGQGISDDDTVNYLKGLQ